MPSASDWAAEMARLFQLKPRPIAKRFGKNGPTPEQKVVYNAEVREWNRLYRHASKMQKKQLVIDNEEFHRKNYSSCPHCQLHHSNHDRCGRLP